MDEPITAWHFLGANHLLGNDDGRRVIVGETLSSQGCPELCANGMHGSIRATDALYYARGPIVCRVELSGKVIAGKDKLVAINRKCLAMADATTLLHEFACWCAQNTLTRCEARTGKKHDPRSWNAIKTKRKWLSGKADDEELKEAWSAAVAAWAVAASSAVVSWAVVSWAAGAKAASGAAERVAAASARSAAVWSEQAGAAWSEAAQDKDVERQNAELEERLLNLRGIKIA